MDGPTDGQSLLYRVACAQLKRGRKEVKVGRCIEEKGRKGFDHFSAPRVNPKRNLSRRICQIQKVGPRDGKWARLGVGKEKIGTISGSATEGG